MTDEPTSPPDPALAQTAASLDPGAPAPAVPARVGRYRIEGELGRGAMATVYAARDLTLHRPVALKLIRRLGSELEMRRLVREAQAIARISHPNVVQVYEVGRQPDGVMFVAMERVEGMTLDRYLATPRPLAERCATLAAAGRGLAAAHAAGVVHRDVKPQNMMIDARGVVRVLDFGLAITASDYLTDSGRRPDDARSREGERPTAAPVGTPAYLSPELWAGAPADERSDQFSFCVCLYEAVAGGHPFDLSSRDALRNAVLSGQVRPLPRSVPRALRQALARGLAVEPAHRFSSMHELLAALERPVAGWRAPRRAAVGAGALAVAATALAVAWRWPRAPRQAAAPADVRYRPPERLTARGDVVRAAVSPDERQLALLTGRELLLQPLRRDAEARVLARGAFTYEALAWSPDGSALVVAGALAGAPPGSGLFLVEVASGAARALPERAGSAALLGDGELALARFAAKEVTFATVTADGELQRRSCALPQPVSGVRALQYLPGRNALLVQLDRGDRESALVRMDRACQRVEMIAPKLAALSFVTAPPDDRLLARLMYRHDLVEVSADGATLGAAHLVQSTDYTPLAVLADGSLLHQNTSARWQLWAREGATAPRELAAGSEDTHLSLAPDGVTVAQVSGVYRDGLLRVGPLAAVATRGLPVLEGATRSAWSPRGDRLAVLRQSAGGYELVVWDRATGGLGPRRALALPYDAELTWLDERRVAFGRPPSWRGFGWLDPDTDQRGELAVGDGQAVHSLVRAPDSGALAYLTETDSTARVWHLPSADGAPSLAAEVALTAPRATRRPELAWTADGLLLFERTTGELWQLEAAAPAPAGEHAPPRLTARALAPVPLPGGGVARLGQVLAAGPRLLVSTVTTSADVFRSARR